MITDLEYIILLKHIIRNTKSQGKLVECLLDLKDAKKFKSVYGKSSSGNDILSIEYYDRKKQRTEYSIIL